MPIYYNIPSQEAMAYVVNVRIVRLSLAPIYKAIFTPDEGVVMYDYDLTRLKQDSADKLLTLNYRGEQLCPHWRHWGVNDTEWLCTLQPEKHR